MNVRTYEQKWKMLRQLLGYVEDGSSQPVKISQDDATREWVVTVNNRNSFHGVNLDEALAKASAGYPPLPPSDEGDATNGAT